MKQLEVQQTSVIHFLNLITRDLASSDFSNLLIAYFTLTIIAIVSIAVRRLSAQKRRNRVSFEDDYGAPNYRSRSDSINESSVKAHETTIHEKCLSELYLAADKCFIEKYAEECRRLVVHFPYFVNAKLASTGQTPFHRVCFHGEASLIELMLAKGANPYLNSDAGESPICLAIHYYINQNNQQLGSVTCLEMLRRAGCSLGDNSIWYDIFLRMAIRAGNESLTKWLLTNGHYAQQPKRAKLQKESSEPWDLKI